MVPNRTSPARTFGRRATGFHDSMALGETAGFGTLSADLRLFALTFTGGLLFMTVYLA